MNFMVKSDDVMADIKRATRIKQIILERHTYETISEKTGISVSTLTRFTSGKTEPKLIDVIKICEATGCDLNWLVYGTATEILNKANTEAETEDVKLFNQYSNLDSEDKGIIKKLIDSLNIRKDMISRFSKKDFLRVAETTGNYSTVTTEKKR